MNMMVRMTRRCRSEQSYFRHGGHIIVERSGLFSFDEYYVNLRDSYCYLYLRGDKWINLMADLQWY